MSESLKILPLGGLGETGALNCMIYESEKASVMVDCGVRFANDDYPGVNVIIPDFSVLEEQRSKIKAVVLTHGHEDHIGALPYFLRDFPVPVYCTPFTIGILEKKLEEFNIFDIPIHQIDYDTPFQIEDFNFDPIFVNHSMMDVAAFSIEACGQRVVHCTDFKIDHSGPENQVIDLAKFKNLGKQGVDLFLSDSTNSLSKGWTVSESSVRANLLEVFTKIEGRIVACLFSSNVFRIQSLIECARITGRKLAFTGRSTKEYSQIARDLDRLNFKDVQLMDVEELHDYPDNEQLVIATGSQAEPRAMLSRLAKNQFRPFQIKRGDTILMSSKTIPGNESRVYSVLNELALLGAEIITSDYESPIHASGHAKPDELKEMLRLIKPKFFLPIHGEYRHLQAHAEIAFEEGLTSDQVLIGLDGDVMELGQGSFRVVDHIPINHLYVSENIDFMIMDEAVRRRRKMAWNGLVAVSIQFDHETKKVCDDIHVKTEGLFGGALEYDLQVDLIAFLKQQLKEHKKLDFEKLQKFFKVEARQFYRQRTGIKPEVIVLIHELNQPKD